MSRTTSDLVKGIVRVEDGVDISPFIDTANNTVTLVCGAALYSDTTLELIERWLSAHLYSLMDRRRKMEQAGDILDTFDGATSDGLRSTMYGQQVLLLDVNGLFAALDNSLKTVKKNLSGGMVNVGAVWLGTPRCY